MGTPEDVAAEKYFTPPEQYTKGEWNYTAHPREGGFVWTEEKGIAFYVAHENGNLIAAAPELYEELQRSQWLLGFLSDEKWNNQIIEQRDLNRQVIAKVDKGD